MDLEDCKKCRHRCLSNGAGRSLKRQSDLLPVGKLPKDAADDFVDRGNRHVALRPEQTASVCRAFVEHRPTLPWKVWYAGSNFRYEKPQRGRYRQFDQVGIEVLGADDAHLDVEVIALGWEFYRRLGLRRIELVVNSLGEPSERAAYVAALLGP